MKSIKTSNINMSFDIISVMNEKLFYFIKQLYAFDRLISSMENVT